MPPPIDTEQAQTYARLLGDIAERLDDITSRMPGAFGANNFQSAVEMGQKLANNQNDLNKAIGKSASTADTFLKKMKQVSASSAAINGLKKGWDSVSSIVKAIGIDLMQILSSTWEIGKALFAIPLNILDKFIDFAASATGGTEWANALEEVRERIGALGQETSKAVIDIGTSMRGFEKTGLSLRRVFENPAEQLRAVTEAAVEMGAAFDSARESFKGNEGQLFAYQKGLGLTWEQIKNVTNAADAMGVGTEKVLRDITKISVNMGKQFGIDAKIISRDIGKAVQDVKHFGTATIKEMAQAAIYSRKLGVELDKIVGVMDAFDTFDKAAENVSMLSQTLGMQIDTFELVKAKTPDEKIDLLRKSMQQAGRSAENLDRWQLSILASSAQVDEQTAKTVFSMKNQGKTLDEIRKAGDKAEKKTLTQEEAMHELSDAIKLVVREGQNMQGGFFAQFFKGMEIGMQQSKEFREAIMAVRQSLLAAWSMGIQFGKMIMDTFPGIKDILIGIKKIFDPKNFSTFFESIKKSIGEFLSGKFSFEDMMNSLKVSVEKFFGAATSGGGQFLSGLKTMFKFIVKAISEGMVYVVKEFANGLKYLTGLLKGTEKVSGTVGDLATGTQSFLGDVFQDLWKGLKDSFSVLVDDVAPALWEFAQEIWKKLTKFFKEQWEDPKSLIKPILGGLATVFLGPALTGGVGSLFANLFGKGAEAATGEGGGILDTVKGGLGSIMGKGGGEAAQPNILGSMIPDKKTLQKVQEAAEYKDISWKQVGVLLAGIGGALAAGAAAFFTGIEVLKDKSWEDIGKGFAGLAGVAGALLVGVKAVEAISNVDWADLAKMLGGAGIAALIAMSSGGGRIPVISTIIDALVSMIRDQIAPAISTLISSTSGLVGTPEEIAGKVQLISSISTMLIEKTVELIPTFMAFANVSVDAEKAKGVITTLTGALSEKLLPKIGELFSNVLQATSGVDIDKAKSATELFSSIFGFIISFTQLVNDSLTSSANRALIMSMIPASGQADQVAKAAPTLTTSIEELAKSMPDLIKSVVKLVETVPADKDFTTRLKSFETLINSLSTTVSTISSIGGVGLLGGGFDPTQLENKLLGVSAVFDHLPPVIANLVSKMGDLNTATMPDIKPFADHMQMFLDGVESIRENVVKTGVSDIIESVERMMEMTQKLDTALNKGMDIDLPARLTNVARGLGLNKRLQFKFNQEQVVINLKLDVSLDAKKLEYALLHRGESEIRMRLNQALTNEIPTGDESKRYMSTSDLIPGQPMYKTYTPGAD